MALSFIAMHLLCNVNVMLFSNLFAFSSHCNLLQLAISSGAHMSQIRLEKI